MVLGEFPIFMALSLHVGPFNVRWTAKSLMENPGSVAYRIQKKVQDNSLDAGQ